MLHHTFLILFGILDERLAGDMVHNAFFTLNIPLLERQIMVFFLRTIEHQILRTIVVHDVIILNIATAADNRPLAALQLRVQAQLGRSELVVMTRRSRSSGTSCYRFYLIESFSFLKILSRQRLPKRNLAFHLSTRS